MTMIATVMMIIQNTINNDNTIICVHIHILLLCVYIYIYDMYMYIYIYIFTFTYQWHHVVPQFRKESPTRPPFSAPGGVCELRLANPGEEEQWSQSKGGSWCLVLAEQKTENLFVCLFVCLFVWHGRVCWMIWMIWMKWRCPKSWGYP